MNFQNVFFLSMMELFLVCSQSFGLRFMQRCTTLITKPLWRVCIDSLLNLIIPACISGFFYVKVIQILRNQEKRADRNRILSISFVFSWLLWVLLWTPKFILGFMQLGFKSDGSSTGRLGNTVLAYLVPFQTNIQILYSQLNPTIFVVLIKKKFMITTRICGCFLRRFFYWNLQVTLKALHQNNNLHHNLKNLGINIS